MIIGSMDRMKEVSCEENDGKGLMYQSLTAEVEKKTNRTSQSQSFDPALIHLVIPMLSS